MIPLEVAEPTDKPHYDDIFTPPLQRYGPWFYPRLYWEAGMIGQLLYLEAEAAGIRSTGIGCFFDDPMHEVHRYQRP